MSVVDPIGIADKLKAEAAALDDVVGAQLGLNTLTSTPYAEVWMAGGTVAQQRAATTEHLLGVHTYQVVFYVRMTRNLETDERRIGELVKGFIDRLHAPGFDFTLGGLVELTRCTRYDFDLITRNGNLYRAGIIGVEAGEL